MPDKVEIDATLFGQAAGKTVIITGAANGIGAATARLYNKSGANVVIGDLESCRRAGDEVIKSLDFPDRGMFVAVDVLDWEQMKGLFRQTVQRFGSVDIVVANAGIMETSPVLDLDGTDDEGELLESREAFKIMNTKALRLAMHHMQHNQYGGSIVLTASTSGYFGGTGVAAYVASKHAVVGLLRACQSTAEKYGIRVNGVAPFFTPTHITASYAEGWKRVGLEANTTEGVAALVAYVSLDKRRKGHCVLVSGKYLREVEVTRTQLMPQWLGDDLVDLMSRAMRFFGELRGYPLPKVRSTL